jgi:hypothetical protein
VLEDESSESRGADLDEIGDGIAVSTSSSMALTRNSNAPCARASTSSPSFDPNSV